MLNPVACMLGAVILAALPAWRSTAAAEPPPTETQTVFNDLVDTGAGALLPYTPFDGRLGLLRRARVSINGFFALTVLIPSGDPTVSVPYTVQIDHALEPSAFTRGFGFPGGGRASMVFAGVTVPFVPVLLDRAFEIRFEVTNANDVLGLVSSQQTGFDISYPQIATRLENFVDTRCDDPITHESSMFFAFGPASPPVLPAGIVSYSGFTQIEYEFVPSDRLQNALRNGDFESEGFDFWVTGGSGTTRISSPVECLDAATNAILELTAGSPVFVSQTVSTPATPYDLRFDYGFAQGEGELQVWIGDTQVDALPAAGRSPGTFRTRQLSIDDPALMGLANTELRFVWNAPTGAVAWLDNVALFFVPEPSSSTALLAAALALAAGARVARLRLQ